jgi:response regulator RpfG family c-di-GMP phosphodiesterase
MLVERGLLTDYQAGRIEAGTTFGLVMGNYRILDRLGAGGMGVVFRAEHIIMRRQVAIKVLPLAPDQDQRILRRFLSEIRAIAQLQHPNIVGAMDAGEVRSPENGSVLHFFVMEYVPGQDLEEYVIAHGPLSAAKACDLIHQVASALAEAHNHHLVHRDIKPSNIRVTPEGQAKLLDFGLTRNFKSSMTEPGTLLGTLDYMAPEQVQNAHTVDIRADLYGLGGVLYWCLIGETPFPSTSDSIVQELTARLQQQPPSIRARRPELPPELDEVLQKLMALRPDDRYATPQEVMRALLPFLKPDLRDHLMVPALTAPAAPASLVGGDAHTGGKQPQILLVDDEPDLRTFCRYVLQAEGFACDEAESAERARDILTTRDYDLLVLDINMSGMPGPELCRYLREHPPSPHLKIIMASGNNNSDIMAQMLLSGADDFLTKPFSVVQLQARVKAALRLKEAQDRTDLLHRHLLAVNQELEKSLGVRDSDLVQARNALVLALAKMVEHRACETGAHLARLQRYCRCLAEEAVRLPVQAGPIDPRFIEMLECCAPLHDVGKVGLPDHILQKPGKLDNDERLLMQTHTTLGAETLEEVARGHGSVMAFLRMAIDIVRHHHERFDGTGYPDRLAGSDIPLAARLFAICDVYDALRSRRIYKPALSHNSTVQLISEAAGSQFDPALVQAFLRCAGQFERIFKESPD